MAYPLVDFSGSSGTQLTTFDPKWLKNGSYTGSAILNGSGAVRMSDSNILTAYYYNDAPTSADYSVELDLVIRDKAASQLSVCGRMSATANTMYFARYNSAVEAVQLYKFVSGSATQLGGNVSVTVSNGNTHRIKLFMSGSTIKVFWNGSELISQTDSSISASGYGGFRFALATTVDFNRFSIPEMEGGGASNAAPTFPGPNIGNQTGTVGTALTSNSVSSKFSDTDALTFSAVGTWPPGVTVSTAGVISGTPTTAGTYSGLAVRATDTAAQTVDSDTFSFTIGAAAHLITVANSQQANTGSSAAILQTGNGTITLPALKDWSTGNVKANETGVTLIINNATTGSLVSLLTGQTTNTSGVLPTLTGLVSGTAYRITTILADGSEGTWKYTAA